MIHRHKITEFKLIQSDTIKFHEERNIRSIERIANKQPLNIYSAKGASFTIAIYSIMNNVQNILNKHIYTYLEFNLAHFQRVFANSSLVEIKINNQVLNITSVEDNYGAKCFNWFEAYSMTQIIQSTSHIEKLISFIPQMQLKMDDAFWKIGVQFLQKFHVENKTAVIQLLNDLEKSANSGIGLHIGINETKEVFIETRAEKMNTFYFPIFQLYKHALFKDENEFNSTLESYLINKKAYIIKHKWNDDPRYWVDFHCLGVCAFAFDQDINITVDSEYIPNWVYERRFD